MFISLRGFGSWAANVDVSNTIRVLNLFLSSCDEIISRKGGTLDKIVEDTIMAVFRNKDDEVDFLLNAYRAATEIQNKLSTILPESFKEISSPPCDIGFASGMVVSGKIGSKKGILDYSVIGNPVNLAARLKAKAFFANETGILLCPATVKKMAKFVRVRFIKRVSIKGRSREFSLYEAIEERKN